MPYTSVDEEFATEVLAHYDLGAFVSVNVLSGNHCWIIAGGLANTNCKLVTGTGTYLLKICDEKTTQQILVQLEALKVLKKSIFR